MRVRPLEPGDLPVLHRTYSDLTAPLGHHFPTGLEAFSSSLRSSPQHLDRGVVLVADRGGAPLGFVRAGLLDPVPERWSLAEKGQGLLFGPFVAPEDAGAGAGLIEETFRYLHGLGVARILAFDPIEAVGMPAFNGGWSGLPERLAHIVRLLAHAGFRVRHREFCLTRLDLPVPDPEPAGFPFDLRYESRDRSQFTIRVFDRDVYAGAVHFSRMYPKRSDSPGAEGWGYIDGLGVMDNYQGRGLGRLLMEHALEHLRRVGCGPVGLTTGSENYRAQNLYFSLGFALAETTITLVREER